MQSKDINFTLNITPKHKIIYAYTCTSVSKYTQSSKIEEPKEIDTLRKMNGSILLKTLK